MPKAYVPNDKWSQRAAKEGYRARSVFKLEELDEKYGILRPGMQVLDVGAAPGSWLQYTSKRIGQNGLVVGMDLKEITKVAPNVKTFVCDVTDYAKVREIFASIGWKDVPLILSDIAPNTTGIKDVDQHRSVELNAMILEVAKEFLRPGGTLVLKVFRGSSFDPFITQVKKVFERIKVVTVAASRDRSREVYVMCWDKRATIA